MTAPLIVNDGMGVDSMAMLIGLHARGERPDLVIHADTGGEKPETLAYISVKRAWLAKVGFPPLTVVRRPLGGRKHGRYSTLEGNCLTNSTLPSLAFEFKSCSLKWKADAMDRFLLGVARGPNRCEGWSPALAALEAGEKPVKMIGYDAGPADSKRAIERDEDEHFLYRYPLREWGWDRARCIREIARAGLPVPVKSACFFCPASQEWEVLRLAAVHPDLFLRAIAMEDKARAGQHGLGPVTGLWGRDRKATKHRPFRSGSWRRWAESIGILRGNTVVGNPALLLAQAVATKDSRDAGFVQIGA